MRGLMRHTTAMTYVSITDCHNRAYGDPDDFLMNPSHSPPRRRHATRLYPRQVQRRVVYEEDEPVYYEPANNPSSHVVLGAGVACLVATVLIVLAISMNSTVELTPVARIDPLVYQVTVRSGAATMVTTFNEKTTWIQVVDEKHQVVWVLHITPPNLIMAKNVLDENCFHVTTAKRIIDWAHPGKLFFNHSVLTVTSEPLVETRHHAGCKRSITRLNRLHAQLQIAPTVTVDTGLVVAHMVQRLMTTYPTHHELEMQLITRAATSALKRMDEFYGDEKEAWWHKWCISKPTHPLATTCSQLARFTGKHAHQCTKLSVILAHLNSSRHNRCGYCNDYTTSGCDCWATAAVMYTRLATSPCERMRTNCVYARVPFPCVEGQSCSNGTFNNCVDVVSVCYLTVKGSCAIVHPRYNMFAEKHPLDVHTIQTH
jgi:hypothetical protein